MRIGQVVAQAMRQAARAAQQAAKTSAATSKPASFNQSIAKAKAQQTVKDIAAGKSIEVIARAQGVAPAVVIKQLEEAGYDVTPTNPSSDVGKTEIRDTETGQVVATEYYDFSYYIELPALGGGPASAPVRDGQGRKVTTSRDPNTGAITTRYEDDLGSGSIIESTQLPDGTKVEKTTTKDGPVTEKTTLPSGVTTEKTTYKNGNTETEVTTPDGKKTYLASDQDTSPAGVQPIITEFGNGKSIDQIAHDHGWTPEQVRAQLAAAGFEVKTSKDEAGGQNGGDTVESASIVEQASGKVVAIQSQNLTEAAANTDAAGQEANQAIDVYNGKALDHQKAWVQKNQNRYATEEEAFAAWEADWNASPEGQEALQILLPYLNSFASASQNELRITSMEAGGDPQANNAAVSDRAGDIKTRNGNFPDAPGLNNIVDMGAQQVLSESPQMREATANTSEAIANKNEADAHLKEVNDRYNEPGPHNKEDRQAQAADVKAAEDAVAKAEYNVNQALNIELAIGVVDQQEAAAKAGADSISGKPGQTHEHSDTVQSAGLFDQQRDDILSGKIDLTGFDDAQVDIALEGVMSRHPELGSEQNFPFAIGVIAQGEALKHRDEIDAAMESLPTIRADPKTPQWMKDLIDSDKVSAALIVALGVHDKLPEPGNAEEKRLLEESPLLFAQLMYLGVHLKRPEADADNPVTKDIIGLAVNQINAEREKLATSTNPEDTTKLENLDLLTLASGYVRASYVLDEWEKTQKKETPQQAVSKMSGDGISEGDYTNPNAKPPTEVGKFIKLLNTNMQAASTLMPQQGMQIWDAVDGDVTAYVNEQAHFLNDAYNKADDSGRPTVIATIGEWQKQMGQFAPPELANVVIDATVEHFDPAIITKHGGPRVRDGLQILADRAGLDGAGDIVDWMLASDANMEPRDLLTLHADGTGETLGVALLKGLDERGTNKPFLEELETVFGADVQWVEQQNWNTQARKDFALFNGDRNNRLTEIFDGLLKDKGDILTKPLKFGDDPTSDNEYGEKLGLAPDRPNAPAGEAKYTDPEKLGKIHEFKQIDWISRGTGLSVDLNTLALLIASGKELPDDENLRKIRGFQSWIEEIGGEDAEVTITPAVYASPRDGVFTIYLMRVVGDANHDGKITRDATAQTDEYGNTTNSLADEDMIIDASAGKLFLDGNNLPTQFTDFTAFQEDNLLDDEGRLYLTGSKDGLLHDDDLNGHVDNINFEGVQAAITTTGEHIQIWGDRIMGIGGLFAGGALIFVSGGLLAPAVVLASSIYFGARSIQTGAEMAEHGQSFDPINPRAKGAWLGFLDPVATSFWLESLASMTGAASLRPLVFGRSIAGLRTATVTRASEAGLSRNLGTELFLRRGLQTNLYRSQLANGSKSIAAISGVTDGAETFFEGMDMAKAIMDGRINLLDWSEDSASWDLVLMGGGAATFALHHGVNVARNRGLLNQAENAAIARANNDHPTASISPQSQEWSSSAAIQGSSGFNDPVGSSDGSDLDTGTTKTRHPAAPKRTLFIGPRDADDLAEGVVFIPTDSTDILSNIRDGGLKDELFGGVVFKGPYTLLRDPAFLAGISSKLSGGALLQIDTGKNAAEERNQIVQNITNAGLRVMDIPASAHQNAPKGVWSIRAIKPASWPEIHANLPRLRNLVNDVNQNDLLPAFQGYISEALQTRYVPDIRAYAVERVAWAEELRKARIRNPETSAFVSFKDYLPMAAKFKLGPRRELPNREVVIHELLHWHVHPDFHILAASLRVTPKAQRARSYNLHEGAADYLTFLLTGPDRFVNRPMGFGAFEVAGQNPRKEQPGPRMEQWQGYSDEVRATEKVVDKMAAGHRRDGYDADQARIRALDDLQRAFFLGDPQALRRFRDAALSVEGIVERAPRTEEPHNALRIGSPEEPSGAGGPQLPSPVESLNTLLQKVWVDPRVQNATNYRAVYNQYARRERPQDWEGRWYSDTTGENTGHIEYLRRISQTSENRPAGSGMGSQILMDQKRGGESRQLLQSIVDGTPSPDYLPKRAHYDFFHFMRAGADLSTVSERIYIDANVNRATDVMDFVIREIVDKPSEYPGVAVAKISGSIAAEGRSDNLVLYIDTPENRQRVLHALTAYHQQHPDHFMPEVPPMTEPVLPGISLASEPTNEMMGKANNILGHPTDHKFSFGSLRSEAIRLAVHDTAAMRDNAGPEFDAREALRANVRERFREFGIDPGNPSRNLPDLGQAAREHTDGTGSHISPTIGAPKEPSAAGGPDPMTYVDRVLHVRPLTENDLPVLRRLAALFSRNPDVQEHGLEGALSKWVRESARGDRMAVVVEPSLGSSLPRDGIGIAMLHKEALTGDNYIETRQYHPDPAQRSDESLPDGVYEAWERSDALDKERDKIVQDKEKQKNPRQSTELPRNLLKDDTYLPLRRLKPTGVMSKQELVDLGEVWQSSTYLHPDVTAGKIFPQGIVNKTVRLKIMSLFAQEMVQRGEPIPSAIYARVHAGGAYPVSPDRVVQVVVDNEGEAHLISPDDDFQAIDSDDGVRHLVLNNNPISLSSPDDEGRYLKDPEAIKLNGSSLGSQQSLIGRKGPIAYIMEKVSPYPGQGTRNLAIFRVDLDDFLHLGDNGNVVIGGSGAQRIVKLAQSALDADADKGHKWSAPEWHSLGYSFPKPIDHADFTYTSGKDPDSRPVNYRLDAFPMRKGEKEPPTVSQLVEEFEKKWGKDYPTKALSEYVLNTLTGRIDPLTGRRADPLTDQQIYDRDWKISNRYLREREYLTSQELAERYGPDGLQPPRKPWRLEDTEERSFNGQKPVKQAQLWDLRLSELSRVRMDGSATPEPGIDPGPLPIGSQTWKSSSKGIGTRTSFGTIATATRLCVDTRSLDPLKAAFSRELASTQRPDEYNQQTAYGWGVSPVLDWTIFTVFSGPLVKISKNKFFGKPKDGGDPEDGWIIKLRDARHVEETPDGLGHKVEIDYYPQAIAEPVTLKEGEKDFFGNTAQEAPNGQVRLLDSIPVDRVIRDRRFTLPVWLTRVLHAWLHIKFGIPLDDTTMATLALEIRQEVKLTDIPRKGDVVPREYLDLFNGPASGSTMTLEVTVRPLADGTLPNLQAFLDNPTVEAVQEMAGKGHIDLNEKVDPNDKDVKSHLPEGHNFHQTAIPGKDAYRTIHDNDGNVIELPDEVTHNLWMTINNLPVDSAFSRLFHKFLGTKSENVPPDETGRVSTPHNLPTGGGENIWKKWFGQKHKRAAKGIRVTAAIIPPQLRAGVAPVSFSTEIRPQANFKAPDVAPVVRDSEMTVYRVSPHAVSPDTPDGVLVPIWLIDNINQALDGAAAVIPKGGTEQIERFLTALEAFPDQSGTVAQFLQKFRSGKEPVIRDAGFLRRDDAQAIVDRLPGLWPHIRRPADLNLLPQGSVTVAKGHVVDAGAVRVAASPHVFLVLANGSAPPSLDQFVSSITSHPNYHPGKDVELYFCRAGTRNGPVPGEPDDISLAVQHDSLARQLGNRLGARIHAVDGDIELGATTILHGSAVTERPDLPLYVAVDETLKGEPADLPRDPKGRTLHLQGNANFDAQWRFWMEGGGGVPVEGAFNPTAMGQGAWVGNHPVDPLHLGSGNGPHLPSSAESTDALLQEVWADPRVRNATSYRPIYDHYIRRNHPQTWGSDLPGRDTVGRYVQRLYETSQSRPQDFESIETSIHFLTFHRPNRQTPATQRIFINVNLNRAGDLADFIAREIVYKPNEYPGVRGAKVPGISQWAEQRSDSAVIYIDTPENRQRVLDALVAYHRQYPHHFMPEVPPMTEPVLPGISLADHPTHEMTGRANHILGKPGSHRFSFGSLRSEAIRLAIVDTVAMQNSAGFDAREALRANVRKRFSEFGIDPDNPSRNLPQLPAQAAVWQPSTNDIMLVAWSGDASRQPAHGEVFFNYPDFGRTPVPDGHFESVYFENVSLEALAETPALAIRETYRSLKPGGDARITTESRAVFEEDERSLIPQYAQHLEDAGFEDVEVFERDAGETRFFQFYAVKPASGAPSGPPGGGRPVVPGPQDPTRTSGDAGAAHKWPASEGPTEPGAFSLPDPEHAQSLTPEEQQARRLEGLNAFLDANLLSSAYSRSWVPTITVSMADAEHFSVFGGSMTPHEFLWSEQTYFAWLNNWRSDGDGGPLVLDISNPSVAATALAQRLSDMSAAQIIVPRAEVPTQWQILHPTFAEQAGTIEEVFENGEAVFAQGGERRVIKIKEHLGPVLGVGASKTVFQLYDMAVAVYREPDPNWVSLTDKRDVQASASQWLVGRGASHVAPVPEITKIDGHDAIVMGLDRSDSKSIERAYLTPSERQSYDVRDVSLINENSLTSLREMRDFYVRENIGVYGIMHGDTFRPDWQFRIAQDGTFLLHDFSTVCDFAHGKLYDFSSGNESIDLDPYDPSHPQSNRAFIREIVHWMELAETVISRRQNI